MSGGKEGSRTLSLVKKLSEKIKHIAVMLSFPVGDEAASPESHTQNTCISPCSIVGSPLPRCILTKKNLDLALVGWMASMSKSLCPYPVSNNLTNQSMITYESLIQTVSVMVGHRRGNRTLTTPNRLIMVYRFNVALPLYYPMIWEVDSLPDVQ